MKIEKKSIFGGKKSRFSFVSIENMSTFAAQTKKPNVAIGM